jgi:chaperone BCS1
MESLTANLPPGLAGAAANIPGYTIISQLILKAFGIDVGDIISFYLVLFGVYQGARILYNKRRAYFK